MDSPRDSTVDPWHLPSYNSYVYNLRESEIYKHYKNIGYSEQASKLEAVLDFICCEKNIQHRYSLINRLVDVLRSSGPEGLFIYTGGYNIQCKRLFYGDQILVIDYITTNLMSSTMSI